MIDIYGLDEPASYWRQAAAALSAEVLAAHAADVDTQARFPREVWQEMLARSPLVRTFQPAIQFDVHLQVSI